jgi:hypothetical protein
LKGSTRLNSSQCMNKNSYYHSFKIRLGSWPDSRLKSWVVRVNPADLIFKKIIIIKATLFWSPFYQKKSIIFLLIFYFGLTWIFAWMKSSEFFLYLFFKPDQSMSRVNL